MAENTATQSAEEGDLQKLLENEAGQDDGRGRDPSPVPSEPTAGKDKPPQPALAADQRKGNLFEEVFDRRKEFEKLLEKLPHEAARNVFEEVFKDAVPKPYHTAEQLVAMLTDLGLACNLIGRLIKALQPQEVKKKDPLPTVTKLVETSPAQVQLPAAAAPPASQPSPPAGQPAMKREWVTWVVAGVAVLLFVGTIIWVTVTLVGSSPATPPADIKIDLKRRVP